MAMSLIPAPGNKRQLDFYEFEINLVYVVSSRSDKAAYIYTLLKKLDQMNKQKKNRYMIA